ncbi:MAG: septum formation initiator family protein [Acidimicrobiales bacterium]|nr:septum formation initiator family protein [Acidimicrobiales bacterium]
MTATVRTTGVGTGTDGAPDLAILLAPESDPSARPRRDRTPGRHLRPVDPKRQRDQRRSKKRSEKRSPAVPIIVGAGIVIAGLFALAAMHALLIGGQIHLDDLRREQASSSEELRRLRLQVAELEAPDRVLDVARDRLGMVDPGEVGYLLPVGVAGGDDALVRVEAAEPPPPPPLPTVEADPKSPEEQEVDAALTGPPLSGADVRSETADSSPDTAEPGSDADTVVDASTDAATPESDDASTAPSESAPDGGQE